VKSWTGVDGPLSSRSPRASFGAGSGRDRAYMRHARSAGGRLPHRDWNTAISTSASGEWVKKT